MIKHLCQQYSALIVQWISSVALGPLYKGCVFATVQRRWKLRCWGNYLLWVSQENWWQKWSPDFLKPSSVSYCSRASSHYSSNCLWKSITLWWHTPCGNDVVKLSCSCSTPFYSCPSPFVTGTSERNLLTITFVGFTCAIAPSRFPCWVAVPSHLVIVFCFLTLVLFSGCSQYFNFLLIIKSVLCFPHLLRKSERIDFLSASKTGKIKQQQLKISGCLRIWEWVKHWMLIKFLLMFLISLSVSEKSCVLARGWRGTEWWKPEEICSHLVRLSHEGGLASSSFLLVLNQP